MRINIEHRSSVKAVFSHVSSCCLVRRVLLKHCQVPFQSVQYTSLEHAAVYLQCSVANVSNSWLRLGLRNIVCA